MVYIYLAYEFSDAEWRLGTDALRYIDSTYYSDPHLYPSLLYLIGAKDHEKKKESCDNPKEEKEKKKKKAKNIEDEDESDIEEKDPDWNSWIDDERDVDDDALFALTL